jgi:uncharacterized protein DUF4131
MAVRGDKDFGEGSGGPRRPRDSLILIALAAAGRALEAEADRWFVWLPVLFAGGIVTYFALENEPDPRVAVALVTGALGLCLALRAAPLGLAIGGAFLAFALGFADAKLRTEMARAPVLSHELRYVPVTGFIENHELRDKGRARLTLRVIALDDLQQANRPYRVRLTLPAKGDLIDQTGAVVTLKATLQPPPEPVEPGGFDFARQAWFARLGGTGYATSKIELAELDASPPGISLPGPPSMGCVLPSITAFGPRFPARPGRSPWRSSPENRAAFLKRRSKRCAIRVSRTSYRFPGCIW